MKAFFLLLASAALIAPVTAAEVGVRHTWGNTTSRVINGSSRTVTQSQGAFVERTSGISGGRSGNRGGASAFDRLATGSNSSRTRESFGFSSTSTTGFSETSSFSR